MQPVQRPADHAVLGIIGANALTLVLALWQDWGLLGLMWPFWMQSVIIGWYARQRMLKLDRFSTEGLKFNDRPVDPTPASQHKVANFFLLHYGFFHFAYFVFLVMATADGAADGMLPVRNENTGEMMMFEVGQVYPLDWLLFAALGVAFWRSHRASHQEHVQADLARVPNLGTLMFIPYARVIPVHLTIVLGAVLGSGVVWLFVLMKTVADVVMHKVEHRVLQSGTAGAGVVARGADQAR